MPTNQILAIMFIVLAAVILTSGCLSILEPFLEGSKQSVGKAVDETGKYTCEQVCGMCESCNVTVENV